MGDLDLADLDLARLSLLSDRDPDLEDAVGVAGLDRVGVQGLGQPQTTGERAHRALTHEELVVLGPLFLALSADRQDPAVHGDLELLGVDTGHVKLQRDVALVPHDIQRRGRSRAERVAGQPLEVPGERVKPGVVHLCLTSEMEICGGSGRFTPVSHPPVASNLQLKLYIPWCQVRTLPGLRTAGRTGPNGPS